MGIRLAVKRRMVPVIARRRCERVASAAWSNLWRRRQSIMRSVAGSDASRMLYVSPCPNSRSWSCGVTLGAHPTCEASTNTGGPREPGKRRSSSLTAPSAYSGCFGWCWTAWAPFSWKSPSSLSIPTSCVSSLRCWPACSIGPAARSSSALIRRTCSETMASVWTKCSCSRRARRGRPCGPRAPSVTSRPSSRVAA